MDPSTMGLFKKFLRSEVLQGVEGASSKKLVGKKWINVTKLLNDLSFWAEVER